MTHGGDDARSITLVFSVGPVQVWRSREYSLLWCERCTGRSRPVGFFDARVDDGLLREVAE